MGLWSRYGKGKGKPFLQSWEQSVLGNTQAFPQQEDIRGQEVEERLKIRPSDKPLLHQRPVVASPTPASFLPP